MNVITLIIMLLLVVIVVTEKLVIHYQRNTIKSQKEEIESWRNRAIHDEVKKRLLKDEAKEINVELDNAYQIIADLNKQLKKKL